MSKVKTQDAAGAKVAAPQVAAQRQAGRRKDDGPARAQVAAVLQQLSSNGAPGGRGGSAGMPAASAGGGSVGRARAMSSMQGAVGNARLSRMMGATIQTKLTVGEPDDTHEREADRVAETVSRQGTEPFARTSSPIAQRQTAPSTAKPGKAVDANMEGRIKSPSGGQPLPGGVRREMESGLGADFSHVRVHDSKEDQADADRLNAKAFTHGSDIWLGSGASANDRKLMAHELTHVVQQTAAPTGRAALSPVAVQRGIFGPKLTNRQKIDKALASKDASDVKDIDNINDATVTERLALLRPLAYQGWAGPRDEYMIEKIWGSFGNQVARLMAEDRLLWNQCIDVGAELDELPQVKELREQFPIDVKKVATGYLSQNREVVLAEMGRFGIPADEKAPTADLTSAQAAEVENMQAAAASVARLQLAQEKARGNIFVGYDESPFRNQLAFKDLQSASPSIGDVANAPYVPVTFNPYKPPLLESLPTLGAAVMGVVKVNTRPYAEVKAKYDLNTRHITRLQSLYPALYAVSREGQSATTAAFAQKTSPAQARQQLSIAMRKLLDDIKGTQEKLNGGDLNPLDLTPIHAQLSGGMSAPGSSVKWHEPLPDWVAKDLTADHDFNKALEALLLESAAQAAFLIAPFTGGAALFVMLAGLAVTGVKAYKSAAEYEGLAQAAKTSMVPGTELVAPVQVERAKMIKEADEAALALAALAVGMAAAGKALGAIKGPAGVKATQPPARTPAEILMPEGVPIGTKGASTGIRRVQGGLPAAQQMFNELSAGGKDITPPGYPGKMVELPSGGRVGLRSVSSSADKSPAIDISIPGMPVNKIHFE